MIEVTHVGLRQAQGNELLLKVSISFVVIARIWIQYELFQLNCNERKR